MDRSSWKAMDLHAKSFVGAKVKSTAPSGGDWRGLLVPNSRMYKQ